ncbi:hypothetical protein CEQ28_013940 [Hafnia alvei]|nr:hypothetical protein CEQ28_013940 [Hafnia alvei]
MVGEDSDANAEHIADMDNPHQDTAENIGGVGKSGGTYDGLVIMGAGVTNLNEDGSAQLLGDVTTGVQISMGGTGIGVTAGGKPAIFDEAGNASPLGDVIHKNVQTSPTDNTSGAVLTVGAFGLGGDSIAVATTSNSDLHHLPGLPFNAIREYKSSDGSTYIIGIGGLSDDGNLAEWLAPETGADGTKLAVRNKTTLFTIYSDMNKPSATDNDFVSKANGGTYGGPLTITSDASALTLQNKNAGKSLYLAAKTSAGDNYWFIGGGSDGNQNIAFHNYIGNAAITLGSDGVITLTDYSTFDSRYVTGTRFGANKTTTWGGQGGTLPAGCAMTGGNFDDDTEYPIYAYLQYCINGTWINATGGVGATNLVSAIHYQSAPEGDISQLINLQPYTPANPEFPLAQYYIDEQGFDWFEAAQKLVGTVFIAFDTVSGVIHQIADSRLPNVDAYSLDPSFMSVIGLDEVPDGCSCDRTWVYDGTKIYQNSDLLNAKNVSLNNKAYKRRLNVATEHGFSIQSCLDIDAYSTDEARQADSDSLAAIKQYVAKLRETVRLANSQPVLAKWPTPPFDNLV